MRHVDQYTDHVAGLCPRNGSGGTGAQETSLQKQPNSVWYVGCSAATALLVCSVVARSRMHRALEVRLQA